MNIKVLFRLAAVALAILEFGSCSSASLKNDSNADSLATAFCDSIASPKSSHLINFEGESTTHNLNEWDKVDNVYTTRLDKDSVRIFVNEECDVVFSLYQAGSFGNTKILPVKAIKDGTGLYVDEDTGEDVYYKFTYFVLGSRH